jgi:hypothetical protein
MLRTLSALKPLIVGLVTVMVLGVVVVAAEESFSGQDGPDIAAAKKKDHVTPTPIPSGTEVPADPALLQALAAWVPTIANIPISATNGGRDTNRLDCHSGKVNFTVTHGWCFAGPTRLFFRVTQQTFKDPFTGQLFKFDAVKGKLFATDRVDDVQRDLEPPTLPEKHADRDPPERVSTRCTKALQQDIAKHVQNLGKNADRTDSPIMRALFVDESTFWQKLCP